jgi:hypothetical protein
MLEPRRLTSLWASTACYGYSFLLNHFYAGFPRHYRKILIPYFFLEWSRKCGPLVRQIVRHEASCYGSLPTNRTTRSSGTSGFSLPLLSLTAGNPRNIACFCSGLWYRYECFHSTTWVAFCLCPIHLSLCWTAIRLYVSYPLTGRHHHRSVSGTSCQWHWYVKCDTAMSLLKT